MIKIVREPEPPVLTEKKAGWLAKFLAKRDADPKARPHSGQYAHPDIKAALRRMSHSKCFYCERQLNETEAEVDHHVEIASDPSGAFAWDNLYLSCRGCNQAKKTPHPPLADCVDPCAPAANPAAHLTFKDELIRSRAGSSRGKATIGKYGLDRIELNYQRARAINELLRLRGKLQQRQVRNGGRALSEEEQEILQSFAEPERPFSQMFRVALRALDL